MNGPGQLAAALRYAIGTVEPVTADQLAAPTPCRDWELGALLMHACDSAAAVAEALAGGVVRLEAAAAVGAEPRRGFLDRARRLLTRCECQTGTGTVLIGGCPMATDLLCTVGAIEIAVHGWDVSQACGSRRPVPEPLAAALLPAARDLICPDERAPQFALPRRVAATASASDRLTAFLGRQD